MSSVIQKRHSPSRRLYNVFLSNILLIAILSTAPVCLAKIETKLKLLNDDYSVPTSTKINDDSYSFSSDFQQSKPQKNDLKRISFETIHNILRDRNAPMSYRINDLRYFRKRSSRTTEHGISKRSLELTIKQSTSAETALNLTNRNLHVFSKAIVNTSRPFEEITSIILHKNNLQEFPLSSLPNLTLLDLSENNFTHFELPSQGTNLRVLNLNKNQIENFTISSPNNTQGNSMIRELHLKDNAIHKLDQMNLGLARDIEVLDLSCNQIKALDTILFSLQMKNLKHLNLAHNNLKSISKETFDNLNNLNTLILSYNEISELNYETFMSLPNLQYLDLSNNQLKGDSIRALQGITDLVGLSIANNWELGDSMQEFVASWSLKELDASGTGLCKIPAVLAQSVRMLKLAYNWLTVISCGDLDSYPLLQYLDLSYSHIDDIEEDALGRLEALERLFLDHNNLKKIPISLPTTLEHLFLQNNQIMDVPLQSFQGLNNLKTLDLSSNKLIYLPDLPLPKLITLNLQSSGINGLHQGIVKTSPHLRDLFLEDNPIKCAELLGITEWASPCRNDRRITKRVEIKLYYVQAHNYFERFQCAEVDGQLCATCLRKVHSSQNIIYPQPYCANLNRTILQKSYSPSTTAKTTRTHFNKTKKLISTTFKPEAHIEMFVKNKRNQVHLDGNSFRTAAPEVPNLKTDTDRKVQTLSHDEIPTFQDGNSTLRHPLETQTDLKSGGNKTDDISEQSTVNPSALPEPTENAAEILQKIEESKSATENHSTTPEIPAKNRLKLLEDPTTTQKTEVTTSKKINAFHNTLIEKSSNTISQKILKLQIKDRHLIGTPLLMHKGHIVLFPSIYSASQTKKFKDEHLSHVPSSQDSNSSAEKENEKEKTFSKKTFEKPSNNNAALARNSYNTGAENDGSRLLIMQPIKQNKKQTMTNISNRDIQHKLNEVDDLQIKSKKENQSNSHSLNTPLKLKTESDGFNIFLERIYDFDTINQSNNTESTTRHHTRINKPVSEITEVHTNIGFESKSAEDFHSPSTNLSESSKTALIFEKDNSHVSERWLDVRNAKRHPGLAAVIVVTIAMVFVVALFKVYRHRKKPLRYFSHQQRYGNQSQSQYQYQKENLLPAHNHQHHQLRISDKSDNKRLFKPNINQNEYSNNGSSNDLSLSKSKSVYKSIPEDMLFKNKNVTRTPTSNYKSKRGKCSFGVFKNDSAKNTTNNYRFFPVNEKRNKDNHPSSFERNDFCIDINHVQQSVLATNLFPMELLIPQSSASSSPPPPFSQTKQVSGLLSDEYSDEEENQETRSLDEEYDGINFDEQSESKRSTFEIW